MSNIINQRGYITNPGFAGGEEVTPLGPDDFGYVNLGYGSLYVGTQGDLTIKCADSSVITLVSASGFIPGLVAAVSSSSTATNIIGFDKVVVQPVTTTTTTEAPTTTTTTEAPTPSFEYDFGYDVSNSSTACSATTSNVYSDVDTLAVGEFLWTGPALFAKVDDGYYAGGGTWYEVTGGDGEITDTGACE
jgi:hypothetical protein